VSRFIFWPRRRDGSAWSIKKEGKMPQISSERRRSVSIDRVIAAAAAHIEKLGLHNKISAGCSMEICAQTGINNLASLEV
jgi:hypothetical protein